MYIEKLFLHDSRLNITVDNVEFGRKNFLVGISGSGKSTILNALYTLVQIASGSSSPADTWSVVFKDKENRKVEWSGKFSKKGEFDEDGGEKAELIEEKITINGASFLQKKGEAITLENKEFPIIDATKSNLYIFRNQDSLKKIYESISSLIISGALEANSGSLMAIPYISSVYEDAVKKTLLNEKQSIKDVVLINDRRLGAKERIIFSHKYDQKAFEDLVFVYTSIFPSVENILTKQIRNLASDSKHTNHRGSVIQLKLKDGTLVEQGHISSGMFKTLLVLADIILSPDECVILMDEIENSLGLNCLQEVLNELIISNKQVILTTHHPKIINNAPKNSWKIVTRKANEISVHDASVLKSNNNSHDPFFQLINSEIYKCGVSQ
ncbi:AAA family ATPase [Pantoea sp. NSTU24]|uniref:AAA family ATPase n=1 Tax=Pantoea sp. NSTU24 TaxID=3391144 RepID=UPI003CFC645B